ncbi:MAG: hypothetical protein ACKVU1_13655 [bacterium]
MRFAIHVLMPTFFFLYISLLGGPALAQPQEAGGILLPDSQDDAPGLAGGAFHCQTSLEGSANASTGVQSEMADDIPASLAGLQITEVTLLVAEWLAAWVQPDGIEIKFYNGACPPQLAPTTTFSFDWSELVGFRRTDIGPPFTVYEMTATLPAPIVITPPMSIGAVVRNSWGANAPYCGFMFGSENVIAGCGGFYVAAPPQFPRWTNPGFGDLWVCLANQTTGVPLGDGPASSDPSQISWGHVKGLYR